MRATKLQELEDMAAKLLATARKLPPGPDRNDILQEIGRFWSKIIALQEAAPRPARRGLNRRRGNEMRKLIALLAALAVLYFWDKGYNNGQLLDGLDGMRRAVSHSMFP
jgi:ferric-dicitrate binding protein FerR (iron transport regulator)